MRLGHIGQKGLKDLEKQCLLEKERLRVLPFCEDYVFEKAIRVTFKMPHIKQNNPWITFIQTYEGHLELLHMVELGIFLSIIDDYSGKIWIYTVNNKSDIFVKFKEWKTLVDSQVGRKVKR